MREGERSNMETESRKASMQLETGKRTIDSRDIPDDLSKEEREALGRKILEMSLERLQSEHPDMKLELDGKWWADEASWGGILYNGGDVWNAQKEGETPGAVAFIESLQDGGAHLAELLPEDHWGMSIQERYEDQE